MGIGTSSPHYTLDVAGKIGATGTAAGTAAQIEGTTNSTGYGVAGYSSSGDGVYGGSETGKGVSGYSSKGTGVYGSGRTYGVSGYSDFGLAVCGYSHSGNGVSGESLSGYAGYFLGKGYFSENLGIGTTTPSYKLDVTGPANLNSGIASGGALLVNGAQAIWYDGTTFSWGYNGQRNCFARPVSIGTTDPGVFALYVNGAALSTGGWQNSDARFKKDVREIDSALDKVMDLHGVSFEWDASSNPDKQFPQGRHYGVIAQEVEQVVPEVVMEGPQGEKAVSYTDLVPILIEAVKQLKAENDALKQRLEALDRKIEQRQTAIVKEVQP